MKTLSVVSIFVCGMFSVYGEETLSSKLLSELPELKKVTQSSYKKLNGGLELKGLDESPGHKAILLEMKKFYKLVKLFNQKAEVASAFPEEEWGDVNSSRKRVEELSAFVKLDDELQGVLTYWLNHTVHFSDESGAAKALKEQQEATKSGIKIGGAEKVVTNPLLIENEILGDTCETKESRLKALAERFELLRKQNEVITHGGFTTPSTGVRYSSGYYYNRNRTYNNYTRNRTYSPVYGKGRSTHSYQPKKQIVRIKY